MVYRLFYLLSFRKYFFKLISSKEILSNDRIFIGIGYILSLVLHENYNLHLLHTEIQEFSSEEIILRSVTGLVIKFDIPRNSRFTKLLEYLENNKQRLGIVSLTLTAASIEGQFLRCVEIYLKKRKNITKKKHRLHTLNISFVE